MTAMHTFPVAPIGDRDLAHDLSMSPAPGETVHWTRSRRVEECACCQAGICVQRVVSGPGYRVPLVVHGQLID